MSHLTLFQGKLAEQLLRSKDLRSEARELPSPEVKESPKRFSAPNPHRNMCLFFLCQLL